MLSRKILLSVAAASLLGFPAWASQPAGPAGKLISNPPITINPGDPNGLPQVTCTGFSWAQTFTDLQLNSDDTLTLDLAIIPFRSGVTYVTVAGLMQLRFENGLINGLPYRRAAWNDVKATIRPGSHDYLLTLNGAQAGPFPNEFPCDQTGDCFVLKALIVRGGGFEEAVAWIDSLSLVRNTSVGPDVLVDFGFNQCFVPQYVSFGGMLFVEPPSRLNPGVAR